MAPTTVFRQAERKPPMSAKRKRRLFLSYLPDWIITIALAYVCDHTVQLPTPLTLNCSAGFLALDKIEGYRRVFSVSDTSLRHPYASLIILPLSPYPLPTPQLRRARTNSNLIDRCQPPPGTVDPPFGLTAWQVCTQTDIPLLRDGFRSFPSGHSRLGFLAFYIAGKLHLFDRRGHTGKAWLSLAPFAGAAMVAISRTMDYRHHWQDVLVGSILGTTIAYFSYRQYYPSLASELSHRPYSPRIKREGEELLSLPMHQPRPSSSNDEPAAFPQQDQQHYMHPHHSQYQNPFPGQTTRPDETEYKLAGTVQRPGVLLEEAWKDGANEHSVPRSLAPGSRS
ncbi:hypothetical protein H0H81_000664 [Sphagnurus paluster]|uniref:Phosphatidic acid phosphatase type 2/haloperoxidase domain-containing protein n=1 Tax=Sphagnurus paluster TaxID=117069 RepID=A0A9P7FW94_9AGAR|nr:hypothetical protein H0H81_000664 [Sphagnurus paluster]